MLTPLFSYGINTIVRRRADSQSFTGSTAAEILAAMRKASPYPEATSQAWMEAWALRLCRWDGGPPVDCSTPEGFLAALAARGEVERLAG